MCIWVDVQKSALATWIIPEPLTLPTKIAGSGYEIATAVDTCNVCNNDDFLIPGIIRPRNKYFHVTDRLCPAIMVLE